MQIDPAILTDTYDTLAERARKHTPGGVLLGVDRAALVRRTATLCGATEKAVTDALAARTTAARAPWAYSIGGTRCRGWQMGDAMTPALEAAR